MAVKNALLCIISLALITCKKSASEEDLVCTTENTIPVTQAVKDFFYFKEGSWWVYKEENSNRTDSIWISGLSESTRNYPGKSKRACNCGWGRCVQSVWIDFLHQRSDRNYKELWRTYHLESGLEGNGDASISRVGYNGYFYWLQFVDNIMQGNNGYEVRMIDNLHVSNTVYSNILQVYVPRNTYTPSEWFAKNMHIIKYELPDSTTWNLVRCNIIQ